MSILLLFDLDDTLVTHRCKVPRQTHHALALLHRARSDVRVAIVTFNPLGAAVARDVGLGQYPVTVAWRAAETRVELVQRAAGATPFYYADDRSDHCAAIVAHFGPQCLGAFHVTDPQTLHIWIKQTFLLL